MPSKDSAKIRLPHRFSRRAMRRQLILRRTFVVLSVLLVSGSFAGGFLWRHANSSNVSILTGQPAVAEVSLEQKPDALRFFDEAVRARFERRVQGALDALNKARDANPRIHGCDLLLGMMALDAGDATASGLAAKKSLSGGSSAAGGNVLLGLLRWLERSPDQQGTMNAADQASVFFVAAEEAAPLDYSVLLYRSDIERYLGRHQQGEELLVRAKHRLNVWDSSDAISALVLASLNAQGTGAFASLGLLPETPLLQSLSRLIEARRFGSRDLANAIAPYVVLTLGRAISARIAAPESSGSSAGTNSLLQEP